MLSDGPRSRAVMDGVTLRDEQVWWQASTVGVEWIERARRRGFVDGPVLGTRQPAEQGAADRAGRGPGRERLADVFEPVARRSSTSATRSAPARA